MPEYRQSDAFLHTLPAPLQDYPQWHRGRTRYALWMLPVDCPLLLRHLQLLQRELTDLLHPTRRQPHVTLFVCGFEQSQRRFDDDFTPAQRNAQRAALRQLLDEPACLQLGEPDSFASAAFLSLQDPQGWLPRWRAALSRHADEVRQSTYVPHLTLGLYRRRISREQLCERLAALPAAPHSRLPVTRLVYARYAARDLFGPLRARLSLPLPVDGG